MFVDEPTMTFVLANKSIEKIDPDRWFGVVKLFQTRKVSEKRSQKFRIYRRFQPKWSKTKRKTKSVDEMLCPNLVERFQSIVIATLFLVAYAPNVLIQSDVIAKNVINQPNQNASFAKKVPFEEYYIEHNVSQSDAKRSFFETGVKLIGACIFHWWKQSMPIKSNTQTF